MSDGADTADVLQYDESVIGVEVDVGEWHVTNEAIAMFCNAVGETNPLYTDEAAAAQGPYGGIIAPPGILNTLQVQGGLDPKVQFGNTTFAAGLDVELYEPVRPGDTIRVRTQIKEVYAKTGRTGTMVFVVRRSRYVNQHAKDVAIQDFAQVYREV
jgi:acyl dehydratase